MLAVHSDVAKPGERILVAQSDGVDRQLLRRELEHAGYVVDAVADGDRALAAASRSPYAAVILDLQVPGMGGVELCHRLRRATLTSRIPVMVLSGVNQAEAVTGALALGNIRYMRQGAQPSRMLRSLRLLIEATAKVPTPAL